MIRQALFINYLSASFASIFYLIISLLTVHPAFSTTRREIFLHEISLLNLCSVKFNDMKTLVLFLVIAGNFFLALSGQTTIRGKVTDRNDHPLPGANIFIKGTYDGCTSDTTGRFSAEYGQALSSVLSLNTSGLPDKSTTGVSLMISGTCHNSGSKEVLVAGTHGFH